MSRKIMRGFTISKLSSVDRPAQEGAVAVFLKRAGEDDGPAAFSKDAYCDQPSRPVSFMTSVERGHAHLLHIHAGSRAGETSWAHSEGEDHTHDHPWMLDDTGRLVIGPSAGHDHEVDSTLLFEALLAMAKRAYSAEERGALAEKGRALPDGSFPIVDKADLGRAVSAYERAVSKGGVAGHIRRRASELEATDLLTGRITKGEDAEMPNADPNQDKVAKAEARVAELEKSLARANALASLSDEQRAHFQGLSEAEQETFLGKSADERGAIVKAAQAADPVVYTANDGTVFRKSDDERFVKMARRADEAEKRSAEALEKAESATFEKRAQDELSHCPGEIGVRAAILKAVDGIKDDEQRKGAQAILKAADEALKGAFVKSGARGGENVGSGEGSPEDKIEELVAKRRAKDPALTYNKAYVEVLDSPEGQALYAEMEVRGGAN